MLLAIGSAIALLIVQSCNTVYYKRHADPPPPPPPPPTCAALPVKDSAGLFKLDTVTPTIPHVRYYVFERVQGASSNLQEYGLLPVENNEERCLLIRGADMKSAWYVASSKTGPSSIAIAPWDGAETSMLLSRIVDHGNHRDGAIVQGIIDGSTVDTDSASIGCDDSLAWDGHPALSPNRDWIVFASNRSGSLNSTDLWYARRYTDGSVGPARPLAGTNTYCDELSPSFLPQTSMTLMFSSSGHTTFGGYDAFAAEVFEDGDSLIARNVANLGAPINTSADEIFPSMSPNGVDLYVASNRNNGRESYRKDFDVFVAYQQISGEGPVAKLTGRVVNSQTQQPVVDAEVTARSSSTRRVFSSTRTDSAGSYSIDVPVSTPVQITAQSDTLFYDSYSVEIPKDSANSIIVRTEPITLSKSLTLRMNFPTAEFNNPYPRTLDSNGIETARTWQLDIDELAQNVLSGSTKIKKISLVGHTDDVDTDESNVVLGKQRVEFVIERLVERGVPRSILEGSSQGEQQLLKRRKDETIDSWRKRCRRVELTKVTS